MTEIKIKAKVYTFVVFVFFTKKTGATFQYLSQLINFGFPRVTNLAKPVSKLLNHKHELLAYSGFWYKGKQICSFLLFCAVIVFIDRRLHELK